MGENQNNNAATAAASAARPHDDDDPLEAISNPNEAGPTRRPIDTAIRQQRMKSWQPILDPTWVVAALLVVGVCFVATGIVVSRNSDRIVEMSAVYDEYNQSELECHIEEANANLTCFLNFTAPQDMEPPILVHYGIRNFYQNHRRYVKSLSHFQLLGKPIDSTSSQNCAPLYQLGNQTLNPCGLIANTLFNDVIELVRGNDANGSPLVMNEKGIAWESDLRYKYKQPGDFRFSACDSCDQCSCADKTQWSCIEPYRDANGTCFRYFYPDDDTTRYLYETYPMVVNPLEGVTNEHFVVWMRTAALPSFRKLYGWINQPIMKGEELQFQIIANWDVQSFRGAKSLFVSTNDSFGGKNPYLGRFFWIFGVVFIGVGLLFGLKHFLRPRKLGDPRYLKYKEE